MCFVNTFARIERYFFIKMSTTPRQSPESTFRKNPETTFALTGLKSQIEKDLLTKNETPKQKRRNPDLIQKSQKEKSAEEPPTQETETPPQESPQKPIIVPPLKSGEYYALSNKEPVSAVLENTEKQMSEKGFNPDAFSTELFA